MASSDAILALSTALQKHLEESYPVPNGNPPIKVTLVQPHEVAAGLGGSSEGFTLCLYRVSITSSHRNQPTRRAESGELFRPSLPVDLQYLITPWAKTIESQLGMLGWLLREMETVSFIPAAQINAYFPPAALSTPVFGGREGVEITFDSLPATDYYNLWDKLRAQFPISATYVARMVHIDSQTRVDESRPVHAREYQYGPVAQEAQ